MLGDLSPIFLEFPLIFSFDNSKVPPKRAFVTLSSGILLDFNNTTVAILEALFPKNSGYRQPEYVQLAVLGTWAAHCYAINYFLIIS